MKALIIATMYLSSLTNPVTEKPEQCPQYTYPAEVAALMQSQQPFYDEDLSGKVTITFTVGSTNCLHVTEVTSSNVYLSNYAMEALDGRKLTVECYTGDDEYTIAVDFVYAM